jgi:hypothetical protein
MGELPPAIISSDLEPRPKCVSFHERSTLAPGMIVREGTLTNEVGQRFRITIAGDAEHRAELDRWADELRVWLYAAPGAQDGDAADNEETDRELAALLDELARDDDVDGARTVFDVRLEEAPDMEDGVPVEITMYIDPTIKRGDGKTYNGPDDVIVTVITNPSFPNSRVELRGLTDNPKEVTVGDPARRDADHKCKIKGLAEKSKYTIEGKQGRGRWVPQ